MYLTIDPSQGSHTSVITVTALMIKLVTCATGIWSLGLRLQFEKGIIAKTDAKQTE